MRVKLTDEVSIKELDPATSCTPCMWSVHDRARISVTHRTPCTDSADDRARIFQTHRTLCM